MNLPAPQGKGAGARWPGALSRLLSRPQRQTLLMMLLALATGVEFLENIMFVFASSHIVGGIDADPRSFALVQAAYAVGSMLMILKQQWLAQRFGYRYYLTGSLLLFMAGTLGAATSTGLAQMVAARFVQGVGGGALFTSCRILVNLMFGPADRPRATRIFMLGIFGASALGPAFAAELVERGVWQDVFYGVLPFAALATLGAWLLLPDAEPREDVGGPALGPLLLFGVAIVALQASLTEARFDLFSHPARVAVVAALALALLAGFLWHQWHHATPVLRLRALRHPVYLTGLAMYFVYYMISNLSGYVFPIYAEQALRFPLATTGWLNTLAATISLAGIWCYLRVARHLKHKKPVMVAGLLLMAGAMTWFSMMPPDVGPVALLPGLVGKGLFGVMVIIPIAGLTFRSLADDDDFAHGYRSKNLMRQIASSFASALGAVLLQNRQFAVHTSLTNAIGQRPAEAAQWLESAQKALMARGFDTGQAHVGALAQLATIADQQARLIACEDLYRLIAVLALVAAIGMFAQRRLD